MLVALIAPRPLLLQTGNSDYWSVLRASSCRSLCRAVYKLLGKDALDTDQWPPPKPRSCTISATTCTMRTRHGADDWTSFSIS